MPTRPTRPGATPRRDFLKLAALVPAVAAGCATAHPVPGAAPGTGTAPVPASPASPPLDGLAALRAFPLDPAAEPAFVFRARGVRGRGP